MIKRRILMNKRPFTLENFFLDFVFGRYHRRDHSRRSKVDNFNGPVPSSLVPLFQNESKCETFHMKMSSACSFIFMQIKVIFIRMVSHLDSL